MFEERRLILSKMLNALSFFSLEQDREDGAVAVKLFSKYGDTLRMNIPNTSKYQKKIEVFLVLFGFFQNIVKTAYRASISTAQTKNQTELI